MIVTDDKRKKCKTNISSSPWEFLCCRVFLLSEMEYCNCSEHISIFDLFCRRQIYQNVNIRKETGRSEDKIGQQTLLFIINYWHSTLLDIYTT